MILQQKKLLFFLPVTMVVILVITLLMFSNQTQKNVSQIPRPTPLLPTPIIITPINVISVSPNDQAKDISISVPIRVTFSRTISTSEMNNIHITVSPNTTGKIQSASDKKTIFFYPDTSLQSNQNYQVRVTYAFISYRWQFTTAPTQNLSSTDQQMLQAQEDKAFSEKETAIDKLYPWRNSFPLLTDAYFVYFDIDNKTFTAKLYFQSASPTEDQIQRVEQAVTSAINNISPDTTNYPIKWIIVQTQ